MGEKLNICDVIRKLIKNMLVQKQIQVDGWMDGWIDGWVGGRVALKPFKDCLQQSEIDFK